MTKTFLKSGNTFRVRDQDEVRAFKELPPNTYTIKFDERAGEFFLEQIDNFELPEKIYGKNTDYADRILTTFNARSGQTGVLLSGIKGAGKTLLAKQTSVLARAQGIPTIVINRDWHGDEFNSFIQSITTPAVVMFDEFEKIYDYNTQRKILTLFDGVFNSRKLMMITTNNDRDVSEYMQNRPGRMFYHFQFDTLGQDFIEEFLNDRLENKDNIPEILKYTNVFSFFNFDMLAAVAEEMNRYGETLSEVLEVLNIKPENRRTDTFRMDIVVRDKSVTVDRNYSGFQPNQFEYLIWADDDMPDILQKDNDICSALRQVAGVDEQGHIGKASVGGDPNAIVSPFDDGGIVFNPSHIKEFNQVENKFVYAVDRNGSSVELHVTRNDPLSKWTYHPDAF